MNLKAPERQFRESFNLLVNSAPWVSAVHGAGRVSKEESRGAEAEQPSLGLMGMIYLISV